MSTDDPAGRPSLRLLAGHSRRVRQGHPWIYSNEVRMDEPTRRLAPGTLVTVVDAGEERLGVATFNPHSLIAARLLDADAGATIDQGFLAGRLRRALAVRAALFARPFYRLVHAEADGLPGVVLDRFDDVCVLQFNSAGMEALREPLLAALEAALGRLRAVVLRRDAAVRTLEGLAREEAAVSGSLDGTVELEEGGVRFLADLGHGQKTGWYFDQRENRDFAARLAAGRRVLDLYCHTGGFALRAAAAGALAVKALDSAAPALALAARSAALNGLVARVEFEEAEVFRWLAAAEDAPAEHDLVIADPPSFVKSRKELPAGLRAYRKLARLSARRTAREGFLVIASCSHHVEAGDFLAAVQAGLRDAGRAGRLLRLAGAGPDHPAHLALPESVYLKCAVLALD
jgi:23S rRNA (cytosine1962-C5)-methyltransferase